ncbi:capsular exopolysaccharide synthesis family protein [Ruminiclostridium sufflavum DSM 19573]|uniref:non-specific protein-tyrosine kinase n=1 Tax=Ruminiclostridium sufflavum DSM 19573 TaxID=1121337 RepID=A0A318XMB6_9FIRM|nr:CpsD/CapB family tyrosine-protein kinase [Ruminiclostridium sufflavum]PYG87784.1 capsular exopolysaccharide synthesis family protein [Ruminiclostridium sufflavum DSM 19573]
MTEISKVINVKYELNEIVEEAYKALRANIQFCELNKKIKTLAVTSCIPNEGKSTVAINLSICMAKAGIRVLYVDADLRKPASFKYLVSNLKGLANYLVGHVSLEEIINATDIEGFNFITCGMKPNNPGDLIASDKFGDFLFEIEKLYDIVIIDTPPMSNFIDGAIIATQTGGTIIVAEAKAVKWKTAVMMKNQLQKANANILGVVLNKISAADYKNYNGNYYYQSPKNSSNKWLIWKGKRHKHD